MGHNTVYNGTMLFDEALHPDDETIISDMLNTTIEEVNSMCRYVDLKYVLDADNNKLGLKHNDAEGTNFLEDAFNVVLHRVRTRNPDFSWTGKIIAQGEECGDICILTCDDDGHVVSQEINLMSL